MTHWVSHFLLLLLIITITTIVNIQTILHSVMKTDTRNNLKPETPTAQKRKRTWWSAEKTSCWSLMNFSVFKHLMYSDIWLLAGLPPPPLWSSSLNATPEQLICSSQPGINVLPNNQIKIWCKCQTDFSHQLRSTQHIDPATQNLKVLWFTEG